jgi:hypothetical protein
MCSIALLVTAACAAAALSSTGVPAALAPALFASQDHLSARGVQIYECRAPVDAYSAAQWTLIAPEADLFDSAGLRVGRHFAGPHWEADDGSRIVGSVKARVDAPDSGAIAWLLLDTKSVGADGRFSGVTQVQRVRTSGGVAPSAGCSTASAGNVVRVPYSAEYVFFKH